MYENGFEPKDRDPRFITIRCGGTLTDSDHRLLALWAATCAEHVLHLFESTRLWTMAPVSIEFTGQVERRRLPASNEATRK